MMAGKNHVARQNRGARGRSSRGLAGLASAALVSSVLAACGTSSAGTGPVTLNFYLYPDGSGATAQAIKNCDNQSHGAYTISYQQLPTGSDGQRQQLVRRLAAHDNTIDILGLDVTWEAEFAEAGWIQPWTGANKAQAEDGTLKPALETAIWHNKLYAVPDNSNTQLLWYRSDLVPNPPKTWAEMIADAEKLAKEGKPHYIEIQGAQYEGATVWFNTMVASAGGTVLNPDATKVTLGAPAVKALSIMKQLASSPAADPSLPVQMENQNRLAMEAEHGGVRAQLPVRLSGHEARQPVAVQALQVGAVSGGQPGPARQGDDRRHRPGGERLQPAPGAGLQGGAVPA